MAFDARATPHLREGIRVLDIGAGRTPTFAPDARPPSITYVGLDVTAEELAAAPRGSYDEAFVADIVRRVPSLDDAFDLVVSWQVLEHVKPLDDAIGNIYAYLRPGGHFVAQFSGTFSFFGMLNRLLPPNVKEHLLTRLTHREKATIFPAYYDHCWQSALERLGSDWRTFEVVPRFLGAEYLAFSRALQAAYVAYEEWARVGDHRNLAGYYLVEGVK